uniref:Uncharacterized protein n=1 Tax=Solanum tuberosum TaxID=4113 RepID=M1DVW2_SOLTU
MTDKDESNAAANIMVPIENPEGSRSMKDIQNKEKIARMEQELEILREELRQIRDLAKLSATTSPTFKMPIYFPKADSSSADLPNQPEQTQHVSAHDRIPPASPTTVRTVPDLSNRDPTIPTMEQILGAHVSAPYEPMFHLYMPLEFLHSQRQRWGLNPESRIVADQLSSGCLVGQSYESVAQLLDCVAKTNNETNKDQHLATLLDMARPKVARINMPPQKKTNGIKINDDPAVSRGKATKLPRKALASPEANSDSVSIYATHFSTSQSEGEHQEQQAAASEPDDDELIAEQRAELRSKKMNDLSKIRTPQATTSSTLATTHVVVLAPPVQGPPPKSINRLKTEGMRTIIEEKRLSTDGVIDKFPEIMSCLKSHKF